MSERMFRRWSERFEEEGQAGLLHRRSGRAVPDADADWWCGESPLPRELNWKARGTGATRSAPGLAATWPLFAAAAEL
jgi:hypothetical protein